MEPPKNALPNIERAMKDLKEYEDIERLAVEKSKKIFKEVQNFKLEKQALKTEIDEQKLKLKYYQDLFVETATKIQNTLIRRNKAKLVESSNMEKLKQTESGAIKDKINWNAYDFETYQRIGCGSETSDLSLLKENLEQAITHNNKFMEELLKKCKPEV